MLTCLGGGDGLADARTALPRVQTDILAGDNGIGLLDDLLGLGEDQLDVAGVGHVGVDLDRDVSKFCLWAFFVGVDDREGSWCRRTRP